MVQLTKNGEIIAIAKQQLLVYNTHKLSTEPLFRHGNPGVYTHIQSLSCSSRKSIVTALIVEAVVVGLSDGT